MKPVENVSIGGYVFSLEDDACAVVRKYLEELSEFYLKKASGTEVMEGIEERMSELLLERLGDGGVVTLPMVEAAIGTLGRPEAIEEESGEDPDASDTPTQDGGQVGSAKENKVKKKLYRDPAHGKVAGVCSGLGIFFSLDPTIFRLAFTIFTLMGLGCFFSDGRIEFGYYCIPMFYAILWVCMPVARTVRQRDELRGERGTVDAISARVRSSLHEMGEVAGDVARSNVWSGIWRVLEVCLGIVFLVTGVAGIVSLGCISIGDRFITNTFFYNRILEDIASEAPRVLELLSFPPLVAAFAVSLVVPFVALIYGGVKLLFDLKSPKWHPGICLLVLWLVALTVLAVLSALTIYRGM